MPYVSGIKACCLQIQSFIFVSCLNEIRHPVHLFSLLRRYIFIDMMKTSRFLYALSQTKECIDKIEVKVEVEVEVEINCLSSEKVYYRRKVCKSRFVNIFIFKYLIHDLPYLC